MLEPISTDDAARNQTPVLIWGWGKLGRTALEICAADSSIATAGIVSRRATSIPAAERSGIPAYSSLDEAAGNHPSALVLHTGHAVGDDLVAAAAECARLGLDFVTSSGLFHPRTDIADGGAELDALARLSGSRVVAAGLQPGFFFDVLPALMLPIATGWTEARVTKPSWAGSWPRSVRHMQGIGEGPELVTGSIPYPLTSSARLLAGALGSKVVRAQEHRSAETAQRAIQLDDEVLPVGTACGYRQTCTIDLEDGHSFTLVWAVTTDQDAVDRDGLDYRLEVLRPSSARLLATVSGSFNDDPYPATIARMLHVAVAMRSVEPGLHEVTRAGLSRSLPPG